MIILLHFFTNEIYLVTYPVYLENLSTPITSIASLSAIEGKKSMPAINSGLIMKRISSYNHKNIIRRLNYIKKMLIV